MKFSISTLINFLILKLNDRKRLLNYALHLIIELNENNLERDGTDIHDETMFI